jgi:hypothetical protein
MLVRMRRLLKARILGTSTTSSKFHFLRFPYDRTSRRGFDNETSVFNCEISSHIDDYKACCILRCNAM